LKAEDDTYVQCGIFDDPAKISDYVHELPCTKPIVAKAVKVTRNAPDSANIQDSTDLLDIQELQIRTLGYKRKGKDLRL